MAALDDEEAVAKQGRDLSPLEKETLGKIHALLESEPDRIFELWARLTSTVPEKGSKRGMESETWNPTYCFWRQISKTWFANLISELGESFGLTSKMIEELDFTDRETVPRLATLFFGIRGDELFPRPLIVKAVMRKWLIHVGDQLGSRWETFQRNGGEKDGVVVLAKVSPFQFVTDAAGKIVGVSHDIINRHGNKDFGQVDGSTPLDATWTLLDAYDDRIASVGKRMLKPKLKEFFTDVQQGNLMKIWNVEDRDKLAKSLKDKFTSQSSKVQKLDKVALIKGAEKLKAQRVEQAKKRRAPKAGLAVALSVAMPGTSAGSAPAVAAPAAT